MSMDDYEAAKLLLNEFDEEDINFYGPIPEETILKAETMLGVSLPPTYRRFLAEYGAGDVGASEFYGILADDLSGDEVPNGIWLTLRHRKTMDLDPALVIVGELGDGSKDCLWVKGNGGEAPVIEVRFGGPVAEQATRQIAEDFGTYFLEAIRTELEDA